MIERLIEYKQKCKVLKQIQSNKALQFKRINDFQNFVTVFVSGFITFIGFSGIDKIKKYIQLIDSDLIIETQSIQMIYNILVFILFLAVVFYMVFRFGAKQTESEKAVALLSGLINEIDDQINSMRPIYSIESMSSKYQIIIQVIPANTDKEYVKAKESLAKKEHVIKAVERHNLLTLSRHEQEDYIIKLIQRNSLVVNILETLCKQDEVLYLGGGIIRNMVWDNLHNHSEMTPIEDVDVIYFNEKHSTKEYDLAIEGNLRHSLPNMKWSVKNQARMHLSNGDQPYYSLYDAISKWPETVSAILLRITEDGRYEFIAPFGFDDLFRLIVRPTPHFRTRLDRYQQRVAAKDWKSTWKKLQILYMDDTDYFYK